MNGQGRVPPGRDPIMLGAGKGAEKALWGKDPDGAQSQKKMGGWGCGNGLSLGLWPALFFSVIT